MGCDNIEDIVLNSLAVNFVLEIDNILYGCFISAGTKQAIEHMEPVEFEVTDRARMVTWLVSTVFYPLVALAATFQLVVVQGGCGLDFLSDGMASSLPGMKVPLLEPSFLKVEG